MTTSPPSRDELVGAYLDQLPFDPYPLQEEALLAWFEADQGLLVCAPTGTGKTLIAEAALFEALHTGRTAYYTTPLIALTEQKFREMQQAAERWGFSPDDVGLVTGNRRVNPAARILVVVAEILLNRLLHPEAFDFTDVSAVVMDEFHNFGEYERGVVWELSLALLPKHVRLLLLSATVGNAYLFSRWLEKSHGRRIELVEGQDRQVPLTFQWVGDQLLSEQITTMAAGDEASRLTPALVFCFNRDECWTVGEQLKGKSIVTPEAKSALQTALNELDLHGGAGPKLKQLLARGVGVHHAGLMPKYRRIVEELFQQKLLSVCVCTETLAAGINLPARSVVLTTLMKGPPGEKKVIDPSSAHQMCGRAGRPQFDNQGYVFALAHEDDVKIARWRVKYDQIPEDTKDPGLRKAKKALKKKMPTRRKTEQYWNEAQFEKLKIAPAADLKSRGVLPWRLLAYLLKISPEVPHLRAFVRKRLMDPKRLDQAEEALDRMLLVLYAGGYVTLEPDPATFDADAASAERDATPAPELPTSPFAKLLAAEDARREGKTDKPAAAPKYTALIATPTATLERLFLLRSVNPLYGDFLSQQLLIADRDERLQALESVLEIPTNLVRSLRVPGHGELPPGPLATGRLDPELLQRGIATAAELGGDPDAEEPWLRYPMTVAEKLRLLFDADVPGVTGLRTTPVWAAGELLRLGGQFSSLIGARDISKQEGIVFRHCLRLILLCGEFAQLVPADETGLIWREELEDVAARLTVSCHEVDPDSTDKFIETASVPDMIAQEAQAAAPVTSQPARDS